MLLWLVEKRLYSVRYGTGYQEIESLLKSGDPRAFELLCKALLDHPEDSVRSEIVDRLRKSGERRAVPALVHAVKDKSTGIAQSAAYAVGELGDSRAAEGLAQLPQFDV